MHHYKSKGGTHFNFNSDMSGDVHVHREPDDAVGYVSGEDLLEFARWYWVEYVYRERRPAEDIAEEVVDMARSHFIDLKTAVVRAIEADRKTP